MAYQLVFCLLALAFAPLSAQAVEQSVLDATAACVANATGDSFVNTSAQVALIAEQMEKQLAAGVDLKQDLAASGSTDAQTRCLIDHLLPHLEPFNG